MRKVIMRRLFLSLIIGFALANGILAQGGNTTPKAPETKLKVGDAAPDFELTDTAGKKITLSEFKGKKSVVLAFYVLAFTGG